MNKIISFCVLFSFVLVSCTPGNGITLPPDLTLVPGTDIPQQVATYIANALTQPVASSIASNPYSATATPLPGSAAGSSSPTPTVVAASQILYPSSLLGIQFSYPSAWYRQETSDGVFLSSFDPSNPPHKLEWGYDTTSMQFGFKVFITPPGSFDDWVESERQTAYSNQLTISEEERFSIATQPAYRLSLVSGSGGVINKILVEINGRYLEINLEGNYNNNLARAVLNSIQPFTISGIKPADSVTPASGVCGDAISDPVNITLGLDASGLPLAGRCVAIHPSQRIRLINQANGPFAIKFAEYIINLPVGGDLLIDQRIGQYLALGVHFLPMGPVLWVKDSSPVSTITPTPIMTSPQRMTYDVTLADNGKTFYMKIGDELRISLDNAYIWSMASISDPNVLAGAQAGYFAFANGTATLTMIGNPECLNLNPPCGLPSIVFTIIAIVQTDPPPVSTITPIPIMTLPQHVTYEITLADNGKTFYMKVGDELRIYLDNTYIWSLASISDPNVLGGAQAGYFAFANGTSTLTMIGNPECLNLTPPCGMPSIFFTITAIVQ